MLCEKGIELDILVTRCEANVKVSNSRKKGVETESMANGTPADAALICPHSRQSKQRPVDPANRNCIKKTASEKESLTWLRRTNDQEPRCAMGDSISEVGNTVKDVTSLLEKNVKVSNKTIQMDNRATGIDNRLKESNDEQLVLLAIKKRMIRNRMNSKTKEASLDHFK